MRLTPEILRIWRAEASQYPSGMACNGVHDRTPDARVIVLIDLVARAWDEGYDLSEPLDREEWTEEYGCVGNPYRLSPSEPSEQDD